MTPSDCKFFMKCSTPICPLDEGWERRIYIAGEKGCLYLLATGKEGADERYGKDIAYIQAKELVVAIGGQFPCIAKSVEAASRIGLRTGNPANLALYPSQEGIPRVHACSPHENQATSDLPAAEQDPPK